MYSKMQNQGLLKSFFDMHVRYMGPASCAFSSPGKALGYVGWDVSILYEHGKRGWTRGQWFLAEQRNVKAVGCLNGVAGPRVNVTGGKK